MDEQPLAGGAALTGAEEARRHGRLGRQVEVRILEDDHGTVAAELEHQGLSDRGLRHLASGLRRANEPDAVGPRTSGDLVADHRAGPGDEVEDAPR